MDALAKANEALAQKADHQLTIDCMDQLITYLQDSRKAIVDQPTSAKHVMTVAKDKVEKSFTLARSNLAGLNTRMKAYEKALNTRFKGKLPPADAINPPPHLINRAVIMHLLREGQFEVANAFLIEAKEMGESEGNIKDFMSPPPATEVRFQDWEAHNETLQQQFRIMYHIVGELREHHNLEPAIHWARQNSSELASRGSNLEFELCRLRYVTLFLGSESAMSIDDDPSDLFTVPERIYQAGVYAEAELQSFYPRYEPEILELTGALAFWANLEDSPYSHVFNLDSAWDNICASFTKEFCSLLGLSPASPLYIACTAGSIALPILSKVKNIMKQKRTEWTTNDELPVEIPLPPELNFHRIFVCPVSKEQATHQNPPMMLQCGHLICKESLHNVSRGTRFKCPYCPTESHARDAKRVVL